MVFFLKKRYSLTSVIPMPIKKKEGTHGIFLQSVTEW